MQSGNEEIDRLVAQRLGVFRETVLAVLSRKLEAAGLVATGELLASMQAELANRFGSYIDTMQLYFAEQGRFAEMKQLNWGQPPPLAAIEKWILSRGINNFKTVNGYAKRPAMSSRIDQQRILRRMARSISLHKRFGTQNKQPVKWWGKNFYKMLNSLVDQIVTDAQLNTGQVLKASFLLAK